MNDTTVFEQVEEEVLAYEVSDEALETAAGTEGKTQSFTLGACTGLSVCPG